MMKTFFIQISPNFGILGERKGNCAYFYHQKHVSWGKHQLGIQIGLKVKTINQEKGTYTIIHQQFRIQVLGTRIFLLSTENIWYFFCVLIFIELNLFLWWTPLWNTTLRKWRFSFASSASLLNIIMLIYLNAWNCSLTPCSHSTILHVCLLATENWTLILLVWKSFLCNILYAHYCAPFTASVYINNQLISLMLCLNPSFSC